MALFKFLKYLQPTHYFLVPNKKGNYPFPEVSDLPELVKEQLQVDGGYDSKLAKDYDLSWQATNLGYTSDTNQIRKIEPLPLKDNYRFVAKYFAKPWLVYVLLIRLISFHNPFKEVSAFFKVLKIPRINGLRPLTQPVFKELKDVVLGPEPLISIIVPTLNRYAYLKQGLLDLEQQDYKNFEVLIVDQSDNFDLDFYNQFDLKIEVIRQEEKALWLARNIAIKQARGDYLLLFDDDSRVETDWVSQHMQGLTSYKADISSGVSLSMLGAAVPKNYSFYRISDQLDTGNVMIKREVFKQIGLFDRQFEKQRMGDGEFGLRAYLQGFKNISNPDAKRLHLKVGSGGLREMGSWDAYRTQGWDSPRPIPSVLYFFRRYFGNAQARYALLKNIPPSVMPYRFKGNKLLLLLGILGSFVLSPLILWQVYKSWRLASRKLEKGPLIDSLE